MAADDVARIVLLPRFSCLAGAATFKCAPINVRSFSAVSLTVWRGDGVGVDDVEFALQCSQDLEEWEGLLTASPDDDEELVVGAGEVTREWVRLTVALSGTNPTACVWAMAEFTKRVGT